MRAAAIGTRPSSSASSSVALGVVDQKLRRGSKQPEHGQALGRQTRRGRPAALRIPAGVRRGVSPARCRGRRCSQGDPKKQV